MFRRALTRLSWSAVVAATFFSLTGCGLIANLTISPLPRHSGVLQVTGLDQPVEILRNQWGVPHVYAKTEHDLWFTQGYVQAQDRWWQMELARHLASGALTSLVGHQQSAIDSDIEFRTLGLRRVAERDWNAMPPDVRSMLEAFSAGVNAYVLSRPPGEVAVEYTALDVLGIHVQIEPWTPIDSVLFAKLMAYFLNREISGVDTYWAIESSFGPQMAADWAPPVAQTGLPTILYPEDLSFIGMKSSGRPADAPPTTIGQPGSNSWIVDGSLTASGKPILANDPHLQKLLPSFFYEIGLHLVPDGHTETFALAGFAFPMFPGTPIGHNQHTAWGFTSAVGVDNKDEYRLTVSGESYFWDGAWLPFDTRTETLVFADGAPDETFLVRRTHFGPVFAREDDHGGPYLASLRWTGLESTNFVAAMCAVFRATNWDEYQAAMKIWDAPAINMSYADAQGNIGYQLAGLVPLRPAGQDPAATHPGDASIHQWRGFVPFEMKPRVLNPARHHIVHANQVSAPAAYFDWLQAQLGPTVNAYFQPRDEYPWRARRITTLLEARSDHTPATIGAIQFDVHSLAADIVLPYLGALDFDNDELAQHRDWLLEWDRELDVDSQQAVLFVFFWDQLITSVYLDEGAWPPYASQQMASIDRLLRDPANPWWDDNYTLAVETRDDILKVALERAWWDTEFLFGNNPAGWRYGDYHQITFRNSSIEQFDVPFVGDLVNRGPFPAPGGNDTVNVADFDTLHESSTDTFWQPVVRLICDAGNWDNSLAVNSTGQSGHPASPNYTDQILPWLEGEYHPLRWSRNLIVDETKHWLILMP